jgi:peptidyl-prolyl cis-trans isomerase C
MKKPALCLMLSLSLIGCGGSGPPPDTRLVQLDGPTSSLKVDGEAIPEALLEAYARKRGWDLHDPGQRRQVNEMLGELLAVGMQARREGLLADPAVLAELELERLNRLGGILMERKVSEPTEEELQAEYQRQIQSIGAKEWQVAHVLFDTELRAQQFIAALEAGADFDAALSSQRGQAGVRDARDLGWVKLPQLPAALGEAISALTPGAWSRAPVQTEFGYHVVLLRATRPFTPPPYAQLRPGILETMKSRRMMEAAKAIREQAKVEF